MKNLQRKVDCDSEPQYAEQHRDDEREGTTVRRREIDGRQRRDITAMLGDGEENGQAAEHDQRDADDRRDMWRGIDVGRRPRALRCDQREKQAEARNHEAEGHDRETGSDPREQGALGGKEDSGIGHGVCREVNELGALSDGG